jgi:hypothetical protein
VTGNLRGFGRVRAAAEIYLAEELPLKKLGAEDEVGALDQPRPRPILGADVDELDQSVALAFPLFRVVGGARLQAVHHRKRSPKSHECPALADVRPAGVVAAGAAGGHRHVAELGLQVMASAANAKDLDRRAAVAELELRHSNLVALGVERVERRKLADRLARGT